MLCGSVNDMSEILEGDRPFVCQLRSTQRSENRSYSHSCCVGIHTMFAFTHCSIPMF